MNTTPPASRLSIPSASPLTPPLPARGFTLIEMLVVLGIIALLTAMAMTIGNRVVRSGEERLTRDTIRVLDTALAGWYSDKEAKFPAYAEFENALGNFSKAYPIIDATETNDSAAPPNPAPSMALFLRVTSDSPSIDSAIKNQVDSKQLAVQGVRELLDVDGVDYLTTVTDRWGRPLRFVHPAFHGGYGQFVRESGNVETARGLRDVSYRRLGSSGLPISDELRFRRSYRPTEDQAGDADEGLCPGNRPYFYSAGPDGDPGTREDNIYSVVPSFPPETRELK